MSQTKMTSVLSRPTPTIEDYLGIIYVMERDQETVIAARLAEMLEVSAPTITATLRRMIRDGWIINTADTDREIRLTPKGRGAARSLMRRHMLLEWMLARTLGMPWSQIHTEAHQIEHVISDNLEARLLANLQDPDLCPHGNPLPGREAVVVNWLPLTKITAGSQVVVRRIHETAEDHMDILSFLESNGILPGAFGTVTEVLPFNETITLALPDHTVTLGYSTARYVFVEPTGAS